MKKNVLALSIATMIGGLGFVGSASADVIVGAGTAGNMTPATATVMDFAEGGIGHALLFPYFNTQNGNMTVLHVVNTDTVNGKAMKVRFRGALNSDDILDFQVFLSPGDVWTTAVSAGSDGVAQIVTTDGSCTLPKLSKGVAQSFVQDRLNSALNADDKGNNTREGYVEMFNMADIVPGTPLFTATKHVNGVAPCTDSTLNSTLTNFSSTGTGGTSEAAARTLGFNTPTTGLVGDYYIINVAQTTTFSAGATAIRARVSTAGADGRANFVHFPQNANGAPSPDAYTADPLFRTLNVRNETGPVTVGLPVIAAANYDLPDMSTPYVTGAAIGGDAPIEQAGLLTNALAVTSITNQYANDGSISAKTDWVFSMPTRRYNVAANYAATGTTTNYRLFTDFTITGTPAVVNRFTPANTAVTNGAICVNSDGTTFYDREETSKTSGAVFSPGTVVKTRFCGETSVLSFADSGVSVLGGSVARQNVSGVYVNGWANVSTVNSIDPDYAGAQPVTSVGLPILGASFIKLANPQATANTSGTYGITWPHRFTR